ncbi:MAG: DMT family transporter [Halioglobus sp.]
MTSKDKTVLLYVALLLLFSSLMGGLFPLVKIAEHSIPPLTLALSRALLCAVVLLFAVGVVMKRNLTPLLSQWKTYAILGILLSVFFASLADAEEHSTASLSALLTGGIPISTYLIYSSASELDPFVAATGTVVFAATSGYFIPIFAILASHFMVGEAVSWLQVAGLGMTLVGAWLVNRSPAGMRNPAR